MTSRDEEELWRSIVENYGERPRLDAPEDPSTVERPAPAQPEVEEPDPYAVPEPAPAPLVDETEEQERFVPPPPPPLPRVSWPRRLAWTAVLGAPLLVMVLALLGATVSSGTGVVVALVFVTGFGYLVTTMDKGPRDPFDDGSAV